ncbi:MAG: hypothetical protein A3F84_12840 [Candidatus Handelsmanbacteria bacterium RIFCSPLOWO2_12_FULL_64_10]|uniref:Uncharacterized protein n=1 Tax=Handelsmanbacteria sp. (strain RIFCSPLOWO2_12_FULL_64_10) TaxID=1817868 RepID=A0A1F6CF42_HANXR|nr:MAG: hypothetical protein A3F84_12840 [Candidatus Handelsmanbacteria bacterium RIFCSPLOWO2_12_FULL_64_10]
MSFLDQLRASTPGVSAPPAEAPPAPASTEADRPPLSPSDPLPAYPFCIRSRILDGAEVWIVPDGWTEPVEGPAYTHAEVAALARQKPDLEALRAIHQVKLTVDGEVLR